MAGKAYRVVVVNPGSTSTKVGVFDGDACVLSKTVAHDTAELARFPRMSDQLAYRKGTVIEALAEAGIDLGSADAFVGRGGGLLPMEGGTYLASELLVEHARRGANGVQHPANLGSQIAAALAEGAGRPAFVVNPPDTDELCDLARVTGMRGVYRNVHLHALNLKETAIHHSSVMRVRYEDCRYVVCHIGGGISVSAHDHGRMVDGYDIVGGEGPMAPTRCGAVPVSEVLNQIRLGERPEELRSKCMRDGGFVDLLGTSDGIEVTRRAEAGDAAAQRAWDAMIYQICKCIGSMATVLQGQVDAILLSGGMTYSEDLVSKISATCSWIAPVVAYPGEFELEAMAAGAVRVLSGEEEAKEYTGVPVFQGFED